LHSAVDLQSGLVFWPQRVYSAVVVGAGVASTEGGDMLGECVGYRVGAFVGVVGPDVAEILRGRHCPHLPFGIVPAAQPDL